MRVPAKSLVLTASLLVASACGLAHAQGELAGRWMLDGRQSLLSGRMATNAAAISQSLEITTTPTSVAIATLTLGGPLGQRRVTEEYVVDSVAHPFKPVERVNSGQSTG